MIGLTGVRVIVIDDEEKDALVISKALAKMGIPVAFFDGSKNIFQQTSKQLTGVRLAILDMDLGWGGTSGKAKAAALVKFLGSILSPNNGPYGVLAWTNHPDLIDEFERYAFVDKDLPTPIFTMCLTKAECKKKGEFSLALLFNKLEEKLSEFTPLLFLEAWEEQCFDAATEVTNTLCNLTVINESNLEQWREHWKLNCLQLMRALAEAEVEKNLDQNTCLYALYSILNPLHADKMDGKTANLSNLFKDKAGEILGVSITLDTGRNAKLNSMLHIGFEQLEQLAPGNIYLFSKDHSEFPRIQNLLDDLINRVRDATGQVDKVKTAEVVKDIISKSKLAAVEISPTCDFAQRNVRLARFLVGMLVPEDLIGKLKRSEGFIYIFGPMFLDISSVLQGQYYLFFSARHFVTLNIQKAKKLKAAAKLRSQALTALQAWSASHAARLGMVLLTAK